MKTHNFSWRCPENLQLKQHLTDLKKQYHRRGLWVRGITFIATCRESALFKRHFSYAIFVYFIFARWCFWWFSTKWLQTNQFKYIYWTFLTVLAVNVFNPLFLTFSLWCLKRNLKAIAPVAKKNSSNSITGFFLYIYILVDIKGQEPNFKS